MLAVIGPPLIQTAILSGSSFAFTWNALPSQQYQIQSTPGLEEPNWTTLGDAIIASNSTMTVSEPVGANATQFYRVVLLP
jgi:hypothetical protein